MTKPLIGISSCLLDEFLRVTGGNKHNRAIIQPIGQLLDVFPVCLQIAAEVGTPRPAIRLVKRENGIRAEYSSVVFKGCNTCFLRE